MTPAGTTGSSWATLGLCQGDPGPCLSFVPSLGAAPAEATPRVPRAGRAGVSPSGTPVGLAPPGPFQRGCVSSRPATSRRPRAHDPKAGGTSPSLSQGRRATYRHGCGTRPFRPGSNTGEPFPSLGETPVPWVIHEKPLQTSFLPSRVT